MREGEREREAGERGKDRQTDIDESSRDWTHLEHLLAAGGCSVRSEGEDATAVAHGEVLEAAGLEESSEALTDESSDDVAVCGLWS